jgi:hypothetical protein
VAVGGAPEAVGRVALAAGGVGGEAPEAVEPVGAALDWAGAVRMGVGLGKRKTVGVRSAGAVLESALTGFWIGVAPAGGAA